MPAADYEARYLCTWDLLREPMAASAGRQGTRATILEVRSQCRNSERVPARSRSCTYMYMHVRTGWLANC